VAAPGWPPSGAFQRPWLEHQFRPPGDVLRRPTAEECGLGVVHIAAGCPSAELNSRLAGSGDGEHGLAEGEPIVVHGAVARHGG
jgi:hypothetical protein